MTTKDAMERAKQLFSKGCTCREIAIKVGEMHEPGCGWPTIDDIADALLAFRKEGLEKLKARITEHGRNCAYCDGYCLNGLLEE